MKFLSPYLVYNTVCVSNSLHQYMSVHAHTHEHLNPPVATILVLDWESEQGGLCYVPTSPKKYQLFFSIDSYLVPVNILSVLQSTLDSYPLYF